MDELGAGFGYGMIGDGVERIGQARMQLIANSTKALRKFLPALGKVTSPGTIICEIVLLRITL